MTKSIRNTDTIIFPITTLPALYRDTFEAQGDNATSMGNLNPAPPHFW